MPDAEYQRIRKQRLKDIASGKIAAPEIKPKLTSANGPSAEYMRNYRASKRAKKVVKVLLEPEKYEEVWERIYQRGRVLTKMMNTPICMWPAEWFERENEHE